MLSRLLHRPLFHTASPCFFFCWLVAPPVLHSFPTRRSSDLRACPNWSATPRPRSPPPWMTSRSPTRSEEHTSELQSRGHLVCRLLLEKKKSIKASNTVSFFI